MYKPEFAPTPIQQLDTDPNGNTFFLKREDLLPYSFGGNKVRIALEYMQDMYRQGCGHMVAYGNARSNLCRVLSNLCAGGSLPQNRRGRKRGRGAGRDSSARTKALLHLR